MIKFARSETTHNSNKQTLGTLRQRARKELELLFFSHFLVGGPRWRCQCRMEKMEALGMSAAAKQQQNTSKDAGPLEEMVNGMKDQKIHTQSKVSSQQQMSSSTVLLCFFLSSFLVFALFATEILHQSMQCVHAQDCTEHRQALEEAPELVHKESRWILSVRANPFDPCKTALHLCWCWNHCKLVFQKRWLLPLDKTGRGALSIDNVTFFPFGVQHHVLQGSSPYFR